MHILFSMKNIDFCRNVLLCFSLSLCVQLIHMIYSSLEPTNSLWPTFIFTYAHSLNLKYVLLHAKYFNISYAPTLRHKTRASARFMVCLANRVTMAYE